MQRFVKSGLVLAAVTAGVAACGAPADGEGATGTAEEQATVYLPEGQCILRAGSDPAHLSYNEWPKSVAYYPGTDPTVLAFQRDAASRGASTAWWVSGNIGDSWLAVDASSLTSTEAAALANTWSGVSPVNAGYFDCTWLWGDYVLPRGAKRPYVPTRIVAFDPNCTKIHCNI